MKILKPLFTASAVIACSLTTLQAATVWEDPAGWWDDHWRIDRTTAPLYTAQEWSMDAFASFTGQENGIENVFETSIRDGDVGGGLGLNYFFTREFGLMSDLNVGSNDGRFIDVASLNLVMRFPLEESGLAPYVFGGGGRSFDPEWEWLADVGAGLEWRFNPTTGLFTDARYMWLEDTSDRLMIRAGLRLVF